MSSGLTSDRQHSFSPLFHFDREKKEEEEEWDEDEEKEDEDAGVGNCAPCS